MKRSAARTEREEEFNRQNSPHRFFGVAAAITSLVRKIPFPWQPASGLTMKMDLLVPLGLNSALGETQKRRSDPAPKDGRGGEHFRYLFGGSSAL